MHIDFVITWVDGDDVAHRQSREKLAAKEDAHSEAASATRFVSNGEIYYLLASIFQYAPWVRIIHIVTDSQRPRELPFFERLALEKGIEIRIVDHDHIFSGLDAVRPNFNSLAIEAVLWRIPDLAECFVYFNDDMFITAPVSPSDFFSEDGLPQLHGKFVRPDHLRPKMIWRKVLQKLTGRKKTRPSFRIAQEVGARLAGFTIRFLHVDHHPHPLRKSIFEAYHRLHPECLAETIRYRFRHRAQYFPIALANHLELSIHSVHTGRKANEAYINPNNVKKSRRALNHIASSATRFACVQSMERLLAPSPSEVHNVLIEKYKNFLPLELAKHHCVAAIPDVAPQRHRNELPNMPTT